MRKTFRVTAQMVGRASPVTKVRGNREKSNHTKDHNPEHPVFKVKKGGHELHNLLKVIYKWCSTAFMLLLISAKLVPIAEGVLMSLKPKAFCCHCCHFKSIIF